MEVFLSSIILCIVSLVFPLFIKHSQYVKWGLLAGGTFMLPWIIKQGRNFRRKTEEERSYESVAQPNESEAPSVQEAYLEVEESIDVEQRNSEMLEVVEGQKVLLEVCNVQEDQNEQLSLEDSLEKGFQAKEEGNYQLAAEWFIYTLDNKPVADIAFYLIVDSYGLLTNIISSNEALERVKPYIIEFFKEAPSEWCIELMEWLEKEKIRINL